MKDSFPAPPSLLLIIPYFGTMPNYSSLFFASCAANPTVNWLVITDDRSTAGMRLPDNVKIKILEFSSLVAHIRQVLRVPVVIPRPYKLCDFKPAYGLLFEEDLKGYEFWGHCDMDMIFGDLRKFLTTDIFHRYDKILMCGHLSIYRNCPAANNYFRLETPGLDHHAVFSSPENHWFDEWPGMAKILRYHGIDFFDADIFADIDVRYYDFRTLLPPNHNPQVFCYDHGRIYKEFIQGSEPARTEYAYIHLQKRKMSVNFPVGANPSRYFITPSGFMPRHEETVGQKKMSELNPRSHWRQIGHSISMLNKRARSHFDMASIIDRSSRATRALVRRLIR